MVGRDGGAIELEVWRHALTSTPGIRPQAEAIRAMPLRGAAATIPADPDTAEVFDGERWYPSLPWTTAMHSFLRRRKRACRDRRRWKLRLPDVLASDVVDVRSGEIIQPWLL